MKQWMGIVVGVALVFMMGVPAPRAQDAVNTVPNWQLTDSDGAVVDFYADASDHTAVLLFWATWCPYCRHLMPHLETLRAEFADRNVKFYALNIWEDGDPVAHVRQRGYGFTLLLNADSIAEAYGVKGTPGVLVVDPSRRLVWIRRSGMKPLAVENELREILSRLAETPTGG